MNAGKVEGAIQCYIQVHLTVFTPPRLFGPHSVIHPKKCHHLATVNGGTHMIVALMAVFSITTKPFIINIQIHKFEGFMKCGIDFVYFDRLTHCQKLRTEPFYIGVWV